MPRLVESLHAWGTASFASVLKTQLKALPAGELPLTEATSQGGHIDDSDLEITVFQVAEDARTIRASVGVFFSEIVICCGCGDEPMPTNGYCKLLVRIDRLSGDARFAVMAD
jgi:hypothetical protein